MLSNFIKVRFIFFFSCLIIFSLSFFPQEVIGQDGPGVRIHETNSCEDNASIFDNLLVVSQMQSATIIIIARLGDGETSRKYNEQRLAAVKIGIVLNDRYPAEKIITAQGDRVRGKARVEVYINGQLSDVFKVGRRQDLKDRTKCFTQ